MADGGGSSRQEERAGEGQARWRRRVDRVHVAEVLSRARAAAEAVQDELRTVSAMRVRQVLPQVEEAVQLVRTRLGVELVLEEGMVGAALAECLEEVANLVAEASGDAAGGDIW